MFPYLLLFVIIALPALFMTSRPFVHQRPWLAVCSAVLVIAIGLRLEVGGDWYVYLRLFRLSSYQSFGEAVAQPDPAYSLASWAMAQLKLGMWAVNTICAVVFTVGLIELSRLQRNPMLAVTAAVPYLVIVVAMGYTRQGAAIGLTMLALARFGTKDTARVFIYLVAAAAFHRSAVVVFPLVAMAYARETWMAPVVLAALALAAYVLFVSGTSDKLVVNYLQAGMSSSGAAIRVAMTVIPALLLFMFRKRFPFDRRQLRLWSIYSVASLAAVAAYLVSPSSTAVDRIVLYLIPLQLVILSTLPSLFAPAPRQSVPIASAVISYSLAIEVVWLTVGQSAWAWLPYRSYIWMPNGYVERYHRR